MRWLVGWSGSTLPTGEGGEALAPVGGRPLWGGPNPAWAVGDWRPDEIRVVSVGTERRREGGTTDPDHRPERSPARLAVLGRCGATDAQLRGGLQAAYGGALRHLSSWPGSYTVVLTIGARTVVLGDLAGACPVFHTPWAGGTAYATAALPLADLVGARPDPVQLAVRLACPEWAAGGGSSVYAGVLRVPPGHALSINSGRPLVSPYEAEPATVGGPVEGSEAAAIAEVTRSLLESVRLRVRRPGAAGGRISTDLTGGSASTALALLAARIPANAEGPAARVGGRRVAAIPSAPPAGPPAPSAQQARPPIFSEQRWGDPRTWRTVHHGPPLGADGQGDDRPRTGAVRGSWARKGAGAARGGGQTAAGGEPQAWGGPHGGERGPEPGALAGEVPGGEPGVERGADGPLGFAFRPAGESAAERPVVRGVAVPGGELAGAGAAAAGAAAGAGGPAAPGEGEEPRATVVAVTSTDGFQPTPVREAELRRAVALAGASPRVEHRIVAAGPETLPYAELSGDLLEGPLTDEPGPGLVGSARLRARLDTAASDHLTGYGARQVLDGHPARLADLLMDRRRRGMVRPVAALARTDGRGHSSVSVVRAARRLARTGYAEGMADTATRLLARRLGAHRGGAGPGAGGAGPASVDALAWCVPGPAAGWLTEDALSAVAVQLRIAARRPPRDERPGGYRARLALHRQAADFRVLAQTVEDSGARLHAPFLDNQVVRAARQIPDPARLRPGARHAVLRAVLTGAGVAELPPDWGAGAPPGPYGAAESVRDGLRQAAPALAEMFTSPLLGEVGLIDAAAVRDALRQAMEGGPVPLDGLAEVVATELWLRRHHNRRGSCWTGMPPSRRRAIAAAPARG
ncbi:asparagine synthase-related protein [Phaeacidiphilus oryzae]|uniref:asparagine synthase-related protein n=1 Tax=Phaeacidiphilus oryzae TaxID=348818 RepID=UPI00069175BE|nr:asparagine synthase-related protein [Phaeacidiphilus oryzae]